MNIPKIHPGELVVRDHIEALQKVTDVPDSGFTVKDLEAVAMTAYDLALGWAIDQVYDDYDRDFLRGKLNGLTNYTKMENILAVASRIEMTPEERLEQAISFAYGNLMCTTNHSKGVTRESIERAFDEIEKLKNED